MKRLFLFTACMILYSDAQVTLTTASSQENTDSFVCGSPETLICTTVPSVTSMTWDINATPVAFCSGTSCSTNPAFTSDYTFTFNVATGIFYMMKTIVTLSDNGTTFTCQDGSSSDVEQANVIVADDFVTYDTYENEMTAGDSTKRVEFKVTTGCLKSATADGVTFRWFYGKVNSTDSRIEYKDISDEQTAGISNASLCIADPDCGVSGITQKSSFVDITEDEEGVVYYFEVDIDYGGLANMKTVPFNTSVKLKVNYGKFYNTSIAFVVASISQFFGTVILILVHDIRCLRWQIRLLHYKFRCCLATGIFFVTWKLNDKTTGQPIHY